MYKFFNPSYSKIEFIHPLRLYGHLSSIEPTLSEESAEKIITFEAIGADWWDEQLVSLRESKNLHREVHKFGIRMFAHSLLWNFKLLREPEGSIPLFHLEFSVTQKNPLLRYLAEFPKDSSPWLIFEQNPQGIEGDLFNNLFGNPTPVRMAHSRIPEAIQTELDSVFDIAHWEKPDPEAIKFSVTKVFAKADRTEFMAVFDVGQGNANALCDGQCVPILYFDLGCGVYRNAHTTPSPLVFCWTNLPPVLLSHWDADHWGGACIDTQALKSTWIVPCQKIGPISATFASQILNAGGRIFVWGNKQRPLTVSTPTQTLKFFRCLGTSRNDSGIAMVIKDRNHPKDAWVLTGDAAYEHFPNRCLPAYATALVVPHHGATLSRQSRPPRPRRCNYRRLIYSYGPGNRHGRNGGSHPTPAGVQTHVLAGWQHGSWLTTGSAFPPGTTTAGGDTLATARHLPQSHMGGILVGWGNTPVLSIPPCHSRVGIPYCTAVLSQC